MLSAVSAKQSRQEGGKRGESANRLTLWKKNGKKGDSGVRHKEDNGSALELKMAAEKGEERGGFHRRKKMSTEMSFLRMMFVGEKRQSRKMQKGMYEDSPLLATRRKEKYLSLE